MSKQKLTTVFRERPDTPEGKYLVKRRDGTVPPWPWFVLGGADPLSPWALRFYSLLGFLMRHFTWSYVKSAWRFAAAMRRWRLEHGAGDPGMGPHRKDDPVTVAEMRRGCSA